MLPRRALPPARQMGFSGNVEPSYIIPTCIGINDGVAPGGQRRGSALEDLDFAIGNEARAMARCLAGIVRAPDAAYCHTFRTAQALANVSSQTVTWPIRHGQVENWDHMERYWQQCMFKCVRSDARNGSAPPGGLPGGGMQCNAMQDVLTRLRNAGTCGATRRTTSCC